MAGDPVEPAVIADFVQRNGLSGRDLDPDDILDPAWFSYAEASTAPVGFTQLPVDLAGTEKITLREAARRIDGGHRLVVGTPQDVAESILSWWRDGAVDGFTLQAAVLPDDLELFVRHVVPILRAEGAFPDRYDEPTIRGRFGLPPPVRDHGGAAVPP